MDARTACACRRAHGRRRFPRHAAARSPSGRRRLSAVRRLAGSRTCSTGVARDVGDARCAPAGWRPSSLRPRPGASRPLWPHRSRTALRPADGVVHSGRAARGRGRCSNRRGRRPLADGVEPANRQLRPRQVRRSLLFARRHRPSGPGSCCPTPHGPGRPTSRRAVRARAASRRRARDPHSGDAAPVAPRTAAPPLRLKSRWPTATRPRSWRLWTRHRRPHASSLGGKRRGGRQPCPGRVWIPRSRRPLRRARRLAEGRSRGRRRDPAFVSGSGRSAGSGPARRKRCTAGRVPPLLNSGSIPPASPRGPTAEPRACRPQSSAREGRSPS